MSTNPPLSATKRETAGMAATIPGIATEPTGGSDIIAASVEPSPHNPTKIEVSHLKDPEVRDFGWNSAAHVVPSPLFKGLSNDDLFTLIRRFNKQVFQVRAIPEPPPGSIDLEISPNEEFSPDKLRATLERFYIVVFVGIAAFGKHIARLRSWNEPRRSVGFCAAYYVAWWYNMILPALFLTFIVLILDPPSRKLLFPPAPLAVISGTTGNLQAPRAGTIGSKDSLTGAPEAHKGEAVEQEARHFVSSFAAVAVSTAAGRGPGEDGNGNTIAGGEAEAEGFDKPASSVEGAVPDPVGMVSGVTESKHLASGDVAAQDPAKRPFEQAMWDKMGPLMRMINDACDTWERFGNALSPTHPFPLWLPRLRLAAVFVPLVFITAFMHAAFVIRIVSFLFGIAFFGQPLLVRGIRRFIVKVPNWQDYLELRRSLLVGVPTNAQLTLTLLRKAEVEKAPIPPPPTSEEPTYSDTEDDDTDSFDGSSYDIDTDTEEYTQMMQKQGEMEQAENDPSVQKRKPGRRIAAALKRTVKAGVNSALGVDHAKAKVGSEPSKQRVGAIVEPPAAIRMQDDKSRDDDNVRIGLNGGEGPSVFSGRLHGKKGHILLVNSATSPCLSFAYSKIHRSRIHSLMHGNKSSTSVGDSSSNVELELKPEFSVGLSDIRELRKMGGFGWKGKMVIGWSMGREVLDGLEIVDKDGNKITLTAIRGRDELFNRLLASQGHYWECW